MHMFPNKKYFFPRTESDGTMQFHEVSSFEALVLGQYGIAEPAATCLLWNSDVSNACMLVPALAAEKNGARLGHGKGYYDRFLSEYTTLYTCVLVPNFASLPVLPVEPHDVLVCTVYAVGV
jgi:5-formyltetrahydrofolate cyclo-ligase